MHSRDTSQRRKLSSVDNMKSPRSLFVCILASFLVFHLQKVQCDIYMHNPRGCNDRLNERNADRANANRLFDSQNNARGGYLVGEKYSKSQTSQDHQYNMRYFMSGSKHVSSPGKSLLYIEWTNQHGCGNQDLNCDIILQYRCQDNKQGEMKDLPLDTIRNGETTSTAPYQKKDIRTLQEKTKIKKEQVKQRFGLNEPWEWYDKCTRRERNKGLFTADQNLDGDSSIHTRQNPNGQRFGYECPEERDYYPYSNPTPWKDIAVRANRENRCGYYKANSFNTKKKGDCLACYKAGQTNLGFKHFSKSNNPAACQQEGGTWVEFTSSMEKSPDHTTKASCEDSSTQDVPLVWGIPYESGKIEELELDNGQCKPKPSCFVAPGPLDCKKADNTRTNHLGNAGNVKPSNYTWVLPYFPSNKEKRCILRIRYNISTMDYDRDATFSDKNGENSPVKNDPVVKTPEFEIPLQLAVNTAQFGRTFQDRSYVFLLTPRNFGSISNDATLHNLNVRGKRGNIVQVYPAVEYDFVPGDMHISKDHYVHIQWTGSNRNPRGNAGEGTKGTDRSNMVETNVPGENIKFKPGGKMFKNAEIVWAGNKYTVTNDDSILYTTSGGFYYKLLNGKPFPNRNNRKKFQNQLNNSPASFPGLVAKFQKGKYNFMCTRNNNFSNRNQKAQLTVVD